MAAPEEQLPQHREEMCPSTSASHTAMEVDDEDDYEEEEEEEDEYGKTIDAIVTKVMNMDREVKPLPNWLDRKLRQSLPPRNGSSASGMLWHSSTSTQTQKYPTDNIAEDKLCAGPGKMVRSVSTPEIKRFVHCSTDASAPKPTASRKVTFGACQHDSSSINSNSSASTITAALSEDVHVVDAFPFDNCPAVGFTYKKFQNTEVKQHEHDVAATRYSDNKENVCPNSLSNKYSLSQGNLSRASTDWQALVEHGDKAGPGSSVFSREPLFSAQVYRSDQNVRNPHIATSGVHNIKLVPTFATTDFITRSSSSVTFTTTNATSTFNTSISASSLVHGTPAADGHAANTKMSVFSTPQASSLLPSILPHLSVKSSSRTPYHHYGGTSLGSRTPGSSLWHESRAIPEYSLPFQGELSSKHITSSLDRPTPVLGVGPYSVISSSINKARGVSSVLQSTSVHAFITTTSSTTTATSAGSGDNSKVATVLKYPTVISSTQLSTVFNSTPAQRQFASCRELFIPSATNNYSHELLSSDQHAGVVASTSASVSDSAIALTKLPTDLSVALSTITESGTSCVNSYILNSNHGIRDEMKPSILASALTYRESHVSLDGGRNISVNRNIDSKEDRSSTVFCHNKNTGPLKNVHSGIDETCGPAPGNKSSDGCSSVTSSSTNDETLDNSGGNTNTGAIHTADPFLLSALRKLDASFDAGHSATLTSYLARNNLPTTTCNTSTAVHDGVSSSSFAPTQQVHRHQHMSDNKVMPDLHYQSAAPTPTSRTFHDNDEHRRETYTSACNLSSTVNTTSISSTIFSKPVAAQSLQAAPGSAQPCNTQLHTTSSNHHCPNAARDHRTQPTKAGPTSVSDCVTPVDAAASLAAAPALPDMVSLYVNGKQYLKLSLLGKGGSSEVFEVLSTSTRQVVAVKVVQLTCADEQTVQGYRNEISLLQRLQHSDRVIKLYDFEETLTDLRLVMERGNSDLARVLKNARGTSRSNPSEAAAVISPFTVQHYWQGMLLAVQAIHQQGIVHSDLKPANFLLVNEMLKLIDFGIATSIQHDMTSVFKDSQAGTYNYMSPESLNDIHSGPIVNGKAGDKTVIKIGMKSDVWSLGCILYNLVYSKTPFQHITNTLQKLMAISNNKTRIEFPHCSNPHLLDTMKLCLQFYPHDRPTIQQLLQHPYLTGVGSEKSIGATFKENIS